MKNKTALVMLLAVLFLFFYQPVQTKSYRYNSINNPDLIGSVRLGDLPNPLAVSGKNRLASATTRSKRSVLISEVSKNRKEYESTSLTSTSSCPLADYGDTDNSGIVELDDLLCILDGYQDNYDLCSFAAADIAPCQEGGSTGDGIIELADLLAVLDAYSGNPACTSVCRACANNQLPTVDLGMDLTATSGQPISLNAAATDPDTPIDRGPQILNYHWEFGDNSPSIDSFASSTQHTYLTAGVYSATVTVTDRCNATQNDSVTITVTASPVDLTPPPPPSNLQTQFRNCNYLQLFWNRSTDDQSGIDRYKIYRDGQYLTYSAGSNSAGAAIGQWVPEENYIISVTAVDGAGNESAPVSQAVTPHCSLPPSPNVAVLLINFPDWTGTPLTLDGARNIMFTGTTSLKSYLEEVSYDQMTATGDAFGWFTLPNPMTSYCSFFLDNNGYQQLGYGCNIDALINDIEQTVSPSVPLDQYDDVVVGFHGIGTVGLAAGRYTLTSVSTGGLTLSTLAHEFGHRWGLMHAGSWDCGANLVGPSLIDASAGGCSVIRYGDGYDPMGNNTRHYSSFFKQLAGFIPTFQATIASTSGEYILDQIESNSTGIKQLRLPLGSKGYFYFVEYRNGTGFDNGVNGVLVRLHTGLPFGTDTDSYLINQIFNPGTPFYDPYRQVRLEVLSKNNQQAQVRVTWL